LTYLVLWLCDMFDEAYSFRETLGHIQQVLGGTTQATYSLPREVPGEDCVEGRLIWEAREFSLYYERSLGYMQFSSKSSVEVEALSSALSPNIALQRTAFGSR